MTLFGEIAGGRGTAQTAVRDEVGRALERLFATRRGAMLLAPAYGVGDATELFHSFPQIDSWVAHLAQTLALYEPRLASVRVVPVVTDAPDLTLRAEIHAVLLVDGKPSATRFAATIDAHCRVSLR